MASPPPDTAEAGAGRAAAATREGGTAAAEEVPMYTPAELASLSQPQSAWRSEAWLHAYPLHAGTVLDYFKESDFYDKTCNNEIVNMQAQGDRRHEALSLMDEGIEYSVDPTSTDSLFLIRKCWRHQPGHGADATQLLSLYVVIGVEGTGDPLMPPRGTVFPMPDLHTVMRTNVATGIVYLKEAFDELQRHAAQHPAVHGYQWKFDESEGESTPAAAAAAASPSTSVPSSTPSASITVVANEPPRNQYATLIDHALMKIAQPVMMR